MQSRSWMAVWMGIGMSSACDVPRDPLEPPASPGRAEPLWRVSAADADTPPPPALRKLVQRAYVKASNTGAYDRFGYSISLSADGSTLAVGAPSEASAATGTGGDQTDDSAPNAGAVYVFGRRGQTWVQQAYLKAQAAGADDYFGHSVALSADGSTLAVGAPYRDGVHVFVRHGKRWRQEAYLIGANTESGDHFGHTVALSADGSTLAVGAILEDSAATGAGDDPADPADESVESIEDAGAAYVFERRGRRWRQAAFIKAKTPGAGDYFGHRVTLSADGSTLAVSAVLEDSAATGAGGDPAGGAVEDAGAVHVLARAGQTWRQEAHVTAGGTGAPHQLGSDLALSADGSTLAVGAFLESSAAPFAGAAYVLTRREGAWQQEAYVEAANTGANDFFGASVALSADGSRLAVGASGEASAATGTGGDPEDDSAPYAGAVYLLARGTQGWRHEAYVKASNTGTGDFFGHSVALSADGSLLAVGAAGEASAATGIDGSQEDDSALDAGAVYLFRQPRR
jgi:FG-GAP repeat